MRVFNPQKIRYARILDRVAKLVFRLVRGGNPGKPAPLDHVVPRRILVLESHLIGDIVMAVPALRALRAHFHSSSIALVAGPWGKHLLQEQGLVDEFIDIRFPWATYDYSYANLKAMVSTLFALRRSEWDLGIDLRGDIRNIVFLYLTKAKRRASYGFTGGEYLLSDVINDAPHLKHVVEYNLHLVDQLGCEVKSRTPSLHVTDEQVEWARGLLRLTNSGVSPAIIGIHPGASKPLRHWKEERFAELADKFLAEGRNRVLLFQGPEDKEIVAKIADLMKNKPLLVQQPLEHLPAIFRCCSVFIGLDSGAVHIADAVGVPTVVLFGPADPERVKPFSDNSSIIIKEGYWCRPCDQVHCVQPHDNCMDALQVEAVYSRALALIGKTRAGVDSGRSPKEVVK